MKLLFDTKIKHDLRHTWATWHVQKGTPLYVLQELGGWASYEMVKRYAHFSLGHLAEYAKNIEEKSETFVTNLSQCENNEKCDNRQ